MRGGRARCPLRQPPVTSRDGRRVGVRRRPGQSGDQIECVQNVAQPPQAVQDAHGKSSPSALLEPNGLHRHSTTLSKSASARSSTHSRTNSASIGLRRETSSSPRAFPSDLRVTKLLHCEGRRLPKWWATWNNEMKPTSHGQDGGSRLISVFDGPTRARNDTDREADA